MNLVKLYSNIFKPSIYIYIVQGSETPHQQRIVCCPRGIRLDSFPVFSSFGLSWCFAGSSTDHWYSISLVNLNPWDYWFRWFSGLQGERRDHHGPLRGIVVFGRNALQHGRLWKSFVWRKQELQRDCQGGCQGRSNYFLHTIRDRDTEK